MHDATKIVINGTTYQIKDLLRRREQNRENINLRTGTRTTKDSRSRMKYTVEEREWQARATLSDLQARYNITETQARGMSWQAREVLMKLGIDLTPQK